MAGLMCMLPVAVAVAAVGSLMGGMPPCSLNGDLRGGKCVCDKPWSGPGQPSPQGLVPHAASGSYPVLRQPFLTGPSSSRVSICTHPTTCMPRDRPDCGTMNFKPLPAWPQGYGMVPQLTTWGGNIISQANNSTGPTYHSKPHSSRQHLVARDCDEDGRWMGQQCRTARCRRGPWLMRLHS